MHQSVTSADSHPYDRTSFGPHTASAQSPSYSDAVSGTGTSWLENKLRLERAAQTFPRISSNINIFHLILRLTRFQDLNGAIDISLLDRLLNLLEKDSPASEFLDKICNFHDRLGQALDQWKPIAEALHSHHPLAQWIITASTTLSEPSTNPFDALFIVDLARQIMMQVPEIIPMLKRDSILATRFENRVAGPDLAPYFLKLAQDLVSRRNHNSTRAVVSGLETGGYQPAQPSPVSTSINSSDDSTACENCTTSCLYPWLPADHRPGENGRSSPFSENSVHILNPAVEIHSDSEARNDFDSVYDQPAVPYDGDANSSEDDVDSAYQSSSGASSTESIMSFEGFWGEENGRSYHTYGCTEYWGPNDEPAQNHQDLSHDFFIKALDGELFTAPLKNPQLILDVGTGTGIWAIDIADKYPSAEVIGIDISPIQARLIPPNLHYYIDDFNSPYYEEQRKYDIIHGRELLGSVLNWPELIGKWFKALKPGGWIDLAEPSIYLTSIDPLAGNHPLSMWIETFIQAGQKTGMSFDISSKLEGWLRTAGFVHISVKRITVPVGGESLLGKLNRSRLYDGFYNFSTRCLTKVLGWELVQVLVFGANVRNELHNPSSPIFQDFYFVHGQKPL